MKYAILKENGQIFYAPNSVEIGDNTVHNPNPEQLKELGYKEVVFSYPENRKWYIPHSSWEENEDKIVQSYEYVKEQKPDYNTLVKMKIYEKNDMNIEDSNDEFALINKGIENPQDTDYLAYREYIKSCKEWAIEQITEYNNS